MTNPPDQEALTEAIARLTAARDNLDYGIDGDLQIEVAACSAISLIEAALARLDPPSEAA